MNLDGFGERHADFEALRHALLRVELQIVVDAGGLVAQPLLARADCVQKQRQRRSTTVMSALRSESHAGRLSGRPQQRKVQTTLTEAVGLVALHALVHGDLQACGAQRLNRLARRLRQCTHATITARDRSGSGPSAHGQKPGRQRKQAYDFKARALRHLPVAVLGRDDFVRVAALEHHGSILRAHTTNQSSSVAAARARQHAVPR
jgi:hypothetical protein